MAWWRRLGQGPRWDGTTGRPRSANGASSFHLAWEVPSGSWVGAEATLEVVRAPSVPKLVFWALQVSFVDRGRSGGGAHLGLQWYPAHPGSTAVNWGGYGPDGTELDGGPSPLPSATGNPNTRDLAWRVHRPYRLRITRSERPAATGLVAWRGEVVDMVTGVVTDVRDLWAAGDRLASPLVWSEVFADCDDPSCAVRWSDLCLLDAQGASTPVTVARVSYQSVADGGCAATDTTVEGGGFVQTTSTPRHTPAGTRLQVAPG